MTHDPDHRRLRAFVTVAERSSFSAAAAALHITQPALSRRIAELESALGLRLFERTSRRVALTQSGQDLLARCRDLLTIGEALHERARALAGGKAGTLRVGCAPMNMERVVAPLIARYRERCPEVDLQLFEQGGERAQQAVLRGDLHVAVASPTEPRLQARLLFPWRLLAVVPRGRPGHPLARGRTVDIVKLAQEPILTLPAGFGTRALFDAGCETASVRPAIRMEATAAQTLLAAAQAGYGVAVVPSVLIMNRRAVKALPVLAAGKSLGRWLAVVWNAQRHQPAYLAEFVDLLAGALKRDYPGRQYGYAPAVEPPRSAKVLHRAP
ncbi:MAG TPA: LysR family transcriptional regulator [Burkholderiales bacterium]|nr:LysR family transcriptional regulator [Burkholderiales bacterium]